MIDQLIRGFFKFLQNNGINPMMFLATIMILWVWWDIRNYKKNKSWKTQRFMVKFNFVIRLVGTVLFILASIVIYIKTHK